MIKDDALHKPKRFCHIETWYFDAVFKNNYSMVVVVTVPQISNKSIVLTGLYLYRQSKLKTYVRKPFPPRCFQASQEYPFLEIRDKSVIQGYADKNTGDWVYNVSLETCDNGVNLRFIGAAAGWKGHHTLGWWLVVPKLSVQGTITVDGKKVEVTGRGYHDHNIYPFYAPLVAKGYHFGKIGGNRFCVTWARVMKNRFIEEKLVVLNQGKTGYCRVNPSDIDFVINEQMRDHGELIPKKFLLRVENNQLRINLCMETSTVHCIRLPALKYWRYHLKTSGEIKTDSSVERINTVELSELLKFF